ncbi:MAG: chemotaxis protein CheW [Nitrospinota bacterium]
METKLSDSVSQNILFLMNELTPKILLIETRQIHVTGLEETLTLIEKLDSPLSRLGQGIFSDAGALLRSVLIEILNENLGYFSGLCCFLHIFEEFEERLNLYLAENSVEVSDLERSVSHFKQIVFPQTETSPSDPVSSPREKILQEFAENVDFEIISGFISESEDEIEAAEANLLSLEEHPSDTEQINPVFRIIHSIKGSAGFLQLKEMGELAHHTEDLLVKMRDKVIEPTGQVFNALFLSIDALRQLFSQAKDLLQSVDTTPVNTKNAHDLLAVCLNGNKPATPAPRADANIKIPEKPPSPPKKLGELLVEEGIISQKTVDNALNEQTRPLLGEILVNQGAVTQKDLDHALKKQSAVREKTEVAELIKIPSFKLDELSELIGEMVVALSLLSQNISMDIDKERETHEKIDQLEKITERLYDRILDIRMFPVQNVFSRLTRQVRDLSLKLDKKIDLEMDGGETLVDKRVIDNIYSPLMHLVRNAIDHGIESLEERQRKGKKETGSVRLAARHRGDSIQITVEDDGGGLNKDALLKKALDKNILREDENITDQKVFATIFHPGFSTASVTTDVSGRGVGMDVVKKSIEQLKGGIEIKSSPDEGTTFLITLPLNTSIIEGLVVQVGSMRFVLSILDVNQTVTPKKEDVKGVQGKEGEFFLLAGEMVPVIRLYEFYDIQTEITDPSVGIIVVVNHDNRKYGLMVDELLHRQQVVIKNMGDRFKTLNGVTGGTILGDGRIGYILNPQELISPVFKKNMKGGAVRVDSSKSI